jgi:hypothetical protein
MERALRTRFTIAGDRPSWRSLSSNARTIGAFRSDSFTAPM